jgi:hypothetical protein
MANAQHGQCGEHVGLTALFGLPVVCSVAFGAALPGRRGSAQNALLTCREAEQSSSAA